MKRNRNENFSEDRVVHPTQANQNIIGLKSIIMKFEESQSWNSKWINVTITLAGSLFLAKLKSSQKDIEKSEYSKSICYYK